MDSGVLIGGVIFTIVYVIVLCIICFCAMMSGIEGSDGKLSVAMGIAILISVPVMWVIFEYTSSEIAFWIICTLPLWCLPWAIYIFWKNTDGTRIFRQVCCCK